MKKYTTTVAVAFGPGTHLELTPAQAAVRTHALEPFKVSGRTVIVKTRAEVQFKAGEVIGLDDKLPKSLVDKLEAVRSSAAATPADPAQ